MTWRDENYSYGQPGQQYRPRVWSITTWLIVINVAVFFADRLLIVLTGYPLLTLVGAFSASAAIHHLQLWRLITFQFLHASLGHIFFNMLGVYFFGPLIEGYLGRRRFLAFYLLCGMAGAAAYMLLLSAGILIQDPNVPLVGASAGIFGILIAAARVAPDARVMLLFPPIPMRLRTLAWVLLGIAAFTIIANGNNAGGQAAHLGGAALGALLIAHPRWLNIVNVSLPGLRRPRFRPPEWYHDYRS